MDALERYISDHGTDFSDADSLLLRELAYERLKDAIRNANLPPGEPLSENKLSRLLGISRTPVREALQKLSQEGLVEIIPGRAVQVANRSFKDVVDDPAKWAKLARLGLIEHVSYRNSRYGGQHGWKLSSRFETAMRQLAEKCATFRDRTAGSEEKDRMMLELVAARRNPW